MAEKSLYVKETVNDAGSSNIAANTFTFKELANATRNFRDDCLLGEGHRGRVYKGQLDSKQVVAIRHVDQSASRKFLVEVLMLSLLHHPNIVNLIGYCADGDQRLLVYEYLPLGSLKDCLRESSPCEKQLDWNTRINIALGAAKGLEHLHDKSQPPVIHRNINCSNILLDEGFQAKLSDFGVAKLGPMGGKNYVSVKFEEGNIGYSAPEYATERKLSVKSDIYSFGVVLLEIFTGRKAIQNSKDGEDWNLVTWAISLIEDLKFSDMVDLKLQGHYPERGLQQVLAVAGMCVQEQPTNRPATADVVTFLTYIAAGNYDFEIQPVQSSNLEHLLNS